MWALLPVTENLALSAELGLHPLVISVLLQRGLTTPAQMRAFLDPEHYQPQFPDQLPGLSDAVKGLVKAVQQHKRVLIWADYDVDGQTSGIILYEGLQALGVTVKCHIAARHGINLEELKAVCADFSPDLVIACDTGIQALPAARYLRNQAIDLVIADHHLAGENLPEATAIIYPKSLSQTHPLHEITSVGITALLLQAVVVALGRVKPALYDLVTLGTLADAAILQQENRYFVQKGLRWLKTHPRPGLEALAKMAGLDLIHLSADDLSFQLLPRLNAFARFGNAQAMFDLLTSKNPAEAAIKAAEGESLNQQRRLLSRQIAGAVRSQVEQDPALLKWAALVIENPRWETGVLGAVAGQLATEFRRPVILLVSGEDGIAHGVARSYGGYDLHAAITTLSDVLHTYGGHAGAVGLSLDSEKIPLLRRRLSNALATQQPAALPLDLSGELQLEQITFDFVSDLERLAPFGNGNPRPVWVTRRLRLVSSSKFGLEDQHWRLHLRDEQGITRQVIWWNGSHYPAPEGIFDLAYQVALVVRQNEHEVQLTFVDWQQVEELADGATYQPEIIDCRAGIDLAGIRAKEPELQIWAEGYSQKESPGVGLSGLQPAPALVVYTAPAHADLLAKALATVQPQRVYFYGQLPPFEDAPAFLQGLLSLLKVAFERQQREISIPQLAERMAQTPANIELGLGVLSSNISYKKLPRRKIQVLSFEPAIAVKTSPVLAHGLAEVAAYRRYLQRIDLENLLT